MPNIPTQASQPRYAYHAKVSAMLALTETDARRSLVPRKLDPPETFNAITDHELRSTGFDVVTKVGEVRG
ncbi:hypothetical protein PIB30_014048 [Stylosanthes scabra]|uniref:Uncharacterized protein n=1 Tax=Stylosanthes scabra TaxID=79078 RepID=A0ABU6Q6G6_9FABA|nr:hypothetical protein [Stylosanthes scabra]